MPLHLTILGSSAGGGLPQWNCGCANCRAARAGDPAVPSRTQSSLAVSSDGVRWALINASPDVRTQLAALPHLAPRAGELRSAPIACTVVTNADLDHTAGLLVLREGGAPPLYCTNRVRDALTTGLTVIPVLTAFGGLEVRALAPGESVVLADRAGNSLGIEITPFAVASKTPLFLAPPDDGDEYAGDTIGLHIRLAHTPDAPVVAYVPGVRDLDDRLARALEPARTILIDGTFATDDELVAQGLTTRSARTMGHAPLLGDNGLIDFLGRFPGRRRVLVHMNNTNPVVDARSDVRARVEAAGIEVGADGASWAEG